LLDVCEFITYEHKKEGEHIVKYEDEGDSMYIILDGQIDFFVDVKKYDIRKKQVDDLSKDL
jgi:hypothetical protein